MLMIGFIISFAIFELYTNNAIGNAIDADIKMQEQVQQDMCFYVTPDNDKNWVTVYVLN